MSDLLGAGVDWLVDKLAAGASVSVVVRRGDLSVCVDATIGHHEYQTVDDAGNTVTLLTDATFYMDASKYTFSGAIAEPASGDTIEVAGDTSTKTYEAMQMPNRQVFDLNRSKLAVHTKHIKTT